MSIYRVPISECPHCGSHAGFCAKTTVTGVVKEYYNFKGQETGTDDFYAGLTHTTDLFVYCSVCDKRLFKLKEIKGEGEA